MTNASEIWVFAEQDNGQLHEVSLELISKGRELADTLAAPLAALLLGKDVRPLADDLIAHGCEAVYLADDDRLRPYTTMPYAKTIAKIARQHEPQIILFGASPLGRDLAPRVASQLRTGLTADCTDLQIGSYIDSKTKQETPNLLLQIRPAFGGNIIATIVSPNHRPQMATVREGVMKLAPPDRSRTGRVVPVTAELDGADTLVKVIDRHVAPKTVNLKGARVIVAGGFGVGSKANFELIRELAHVLGAEVGASRAAVDAGLIDREHQVGQTGTTVRPKLYIACGISGAIQHQAGMAQAGTIVAINTDPQAPIFGIAHYGIVGDLNDVIPKLIKAYRAK